MLSETKGNNTRSHLILRAWNMTACVFISIHLFNSLSSPWHQLCAVEETASQLALWVANPF